MGEDIVVNINFQKMVKIKTKQSIHNKPKFVGILIIFAVVLCAILNLAHKNSVSNLDSNYEENQITSSNDNSNSSVSEEISNQCSICGRTFHNRGYEEGTDGIWRELSEGNRGDICSPACGEKHNQQFNAIEKKYGVGSESSRTNLPNNSYNTVDKEGNLQEPNACPVCKGKGYELGRNIGNGEREMITCRFCHGSGSKYN